MTKSQQGYPTDLNDTEWAQIAPYLPKPSSTGAPRKHGWRILLNAMFYIVKNGCVWRALPHDYPGWKTVYHYFRLFRQTGLWEELNTQIRTAVREKEGRAPQASAMIADSRWRKTRR
jgi:putative transposase